jgi:hypothetical protein
MDSRITLQRRSIKMKGKEEDWAGIEPLFSASRDSQPAEKNESIIPDDIPPDSIILGSTISGGSICRDDNFLYVKIDFSNGKPSFTARGISRMLTLHQSRPARPYVNFEVSTGKNGATHSDIWYSTLNKTYESGSYSVGPSFIEMKYPLALIRKYFDLSKPIGAYLRFWSAKAWSYTSQTAEINILVENE